MMHIMVISDLDTDGFCQYDFTLVEKAGLLTAVKGIPDEKTVIYDRGVSPMSVLRNSQPARWLGNDLMIGNERFAIVGQTPDGDYLAEVME